MSNGYLQDSGFGRDSLLDAISRIGVLETSVAALQVDPRVVATLKGNLTGGGLSTSFTTAASDNLSIVSLTATAINFAFGTARPDTAYGAYLIPSSGIAMLGDCSLVSETTTTFAINTATNGAAADPRGLTTEFFVCVFHKGS